MNRVATLEGHEAAPHGALKQTMSRIATLIDEANRDVTHPMSLGQVAEREVETSAGTNALAAAQDPNALLQAAMSESDRMLAEDQNWKAELAEMRKKLDT